MERSEPIIVCSYFIDEFTNPTSARQVVRSFRSLVVQIRYLNEITSSVPLLNIWSRTQNIPIKEETTVEKDWNICVK